MKHILTLLAVLLLAPAAALCAETSKADADTKTLRVFIFAGQSNMEGADSKVKDIQRFPPFAGLDLPQDKVLFSYNIGREQKKDSKGWVALQPVGTMVGPELSFARRVSEETGAPIAIIKCAAGGTTLGGDWNPDEPSGFKLYPLALDLVRASLAELDRKKVPYRIEGFMWHQGENDMFNKEFKPNYGKNLKNFLASWRRDLKTPGLKFYLGELCTKTIWGMDNRENMYAIRAGQKAVTESDALAEYIPTSHNAVEIGGGEGLHYHYGTLGQLEHGVNYADAYLKTIGKKPAARALKVWPYAKGSPVKLFILAGHRNMEGERAFTQEAKELAVDDGKIAFKYSLGGGYKISNGWEPLGPAGYYDTFGPELSFGKTLQAKVTGNIAIAKFTHSGSQMNDWTPKGTEAKDRNLYPQFIAFIQESIRELQAKGHEVELSAIMYHVGENDMAFGPYRSNAAKWLQSTVAKSREDLAMPALKWFVNQQPPTDEKGLNRIDVTANLAAIAAADPAFIHLKAFNLPPQGEKLVITTSGIVQLGELLAQGYLNADEEMIMDGNMYSIKIIAIFVIALLTNLETRADLIKLTPAPSPADNPLKGLVPYSNMAGETFPHSMEFEYLPLSELMMGADAFDWQPLEALLNGIASRGNQAIFRVWVEFPGRKTGLPKFLIDQGVKVTQWKNDSEKPPADVCYSPDYADERLVKALENFITALGKRYDGDPRIAYITAGLLGSWGEWHTWPRADLFASVKTQQRVLAAYERALKRTPVLLRYPAGKDHPALAPNAHLAFGYHDDSFAWGTLDIGKESASWFYMPTLKTAGDGALNKWRTQPIGGEVRPEVWGQIHDAKPKHAKAQDFAACVEQTHVTWLMESGLFSKKTEPERHRRAVAQVRRMGYDFHVPTATITRDGERMKVGVSVVNQGVAPFYRDWRIELAALDAQGQISQRWPVDWEITGLLPGDAAREWKITLDLPQKPATNLTLALRIINPLTNGKPLRFANAEQDRHAPGWLSLGVLP